jgi:THO complex subunit 1
MFQSFPLGDKSSVNLRGEFHTENVTTFDEIPKKPKDDEMETDIVGATEVVADSEDRRLADDQHQDAHGPQAKDEPPKSSEPVLPDKKDEGRDEVQKKTIDLDALYPIFWGLQAYFSSPTRLFDAQHFASFKRGLEETLETFKLIKGDIDTRSATKAPDEVRRGLKRKRTADGVEISTTFNPKYLTSRELFDLEVIFTTTNYSLELY